MKDIVAIDMFCGAGGESTGLAQACGEMGLKLKLSAINHWERAIQTHSLNHPSAEHFCQDTETLKPSALKINRCALLWASPSCTHHSVARGGKPRDEQSRATPWHVLNWLGEIYVDRLIVENVPEFQNWGPLGVDGKPLASKKGETFRTWVNALRGLGYTVEWRVLNAADYGDPTTRRRLFVQAVRGTKQIIWPTPTHQPKESENFARWHAARECIDWNIHGTSIFNRKHSLCVRTLARIAHGLQKFGGASAEPFLVKLYGTAKAAGLNLPMPTITSGGNHFGLVQPYLTRFNEGAERNHDLDSPIPVIDCSNRYGIVEPYIIKQYGESKSGGLFDPMPTVTAGPGHIGLVQPLLLPQHAGKPGNINRALSVDAPMPTVATAGAHAIAEPFIVKYYGTGRAASIGEPLDTVTTDDRFGLVRPEDCDILFRMLQPHELSAAQGFPEKYRFAGCKEEVVKQIGNAVPVNLARELCKAALSA